MFIGYCPKESNFLKLNRLGLFFSSVVEDLGSAWLEEIITFVLTGSKITCAHHGKD